VQWKSEVALETRPFDFLYLDICVSHCIELTWPSARSSILKCVSIPDTNFQIKKSHIRMRHSFMTLSLTSAWLNTNKLSDEQTIWLSDPTTAGRYWRLQRRCSLRRYRLLVQGCPVSVKVKRGCNCSPTIPFDINSDIKRKGSAKILRWYGCWLMSFPKKLLKYLSSLRMQKKRDLSAHFIRVIARIISYFKHESSAYGEAAPSAKSLCAHFDPVCILLFPHLTRW